MKIKYILKLSSLSLITLTLMSFSFSETITIYGTQSARYTSNTSSSCCTPHSLHSYNQSSMYTSGCWWHDVYDQCFENRNTAIWRFDLSNLPDDMQFFEASFEYDMNYCQSRGFLMTTNEVGPILNDLAYNLWHNPDWEVSLYNNVDCTSGTHSATIPQSQITYGSQSGQLNILITDTDLYIDNSGLDAPRLVIEYQPYECADQTTEENCDSDESCQWIEDIQWDNCGNYNNSNACNQAHPDCYWDLCYGGNYGDWYHCCRGGSFQNDNSYCEEVIPASRFTFGNVTSNMMEINYLSESDIGGFQFTLTDNPDLISITDINGGVAEESDFTISFNDNTGIIIGFSFNGETIPAGNGLLTNIYYAYNSPGETEVCIADVIVSDPDGQGLLTNGDCTQISGGLLGDLNNDGVLNIVDIVTLVNLIIQNEPIDNPLADVNQDGSINVLDVISLVNIILE